MNEQIFIREYEREKVFLEKWGNIINNKIINALKDKKINTDLFLKIPSSVRIKDNKSIINKAFYRKKNYTNPLMDITDKVGIRFVVLLGNEISILEDIIEEEESWTFSKDRDYEKEREENPTLFDYQSVHYILRNKEEIKLKDITIPKETACEVQIRTLLQHAYSELTHDTIYKPNKSAEAWVKRLVARSMAMIETTDTIFEEVDKVMNNNKNIIDDLLPIIESEYATIAKSEDDLNLVNIIIDAYENELNDLNLDDFRDFLRKKSKVLRTQINRKYNNYLLFRQPIILLLFYLVDRKRVATRNSWPFTTEMLKPIYISLGYKFDI
ncbi:MAG: hypothetical protein KH116_16050 [Clostridium sp.]|nr:hypothetical protein [Clostridium sp.]